MAASNADAGIKILSFGAVLWDRIGDKEYIGGAPFNLAAHLAQCGVHSSLMTRVGADPAGRRAQQEMVRLGLDVSLVQIDPVHPTGWASVELDEQGAPKFTFPNDPAYDFIEADEATLQQLSAAKFDIICFGTMEQMNEIARRSLDKTIKAVGAGRVFYDINIRRDYYPKEILHHSLSLSDIVKLNAEEARLLPVRLYGKEMTEAEFVDRLREHYPLQILCITRGADGCTLYTQGETADIPVPPVKVADTVGSGDAFSAGLLYELCLGRSPIEAVRTANALGAFVASRNGAVPEYTDEIRRLLHPDRTI